MGGVTDFADDPYTANVGFNPTENWFFWVGIKYISGSMTYGVEAKISLETDVDFFERAELSDPAYLASHHVEVTPKSNPPFPPLQRVALCTDPDNPDYTVPVRNVAPPQTLRPLVFEDWTPEQLNVRRNYTNASSSNKESNYTNTLSSNKE